MKRGRDFRIYLGADHAGYFLKEKIKKFFLKEKIDYIDLGGNGEENDDYPIYGFKVAESVAKNKKNRGILICGTGTGMCIAANKIKGIRAVSANDFYSAKMSRFDNDTNVLCLRARGVKEMNNLKIVKIWLATKFSEKERHKRRIKEIENFEKRVFG